MAGPQIHMAMGQNPNRTPSEQPNPTTKIGSKREARHYMAMGQNPVTAVNIPIPPPKIGSKMGSEFTSPKMVPLVLTHSHIEPNNPELPLLVMFGGYSPNGTSNTRHGVFSTNGGFWGSHEYLEESNLFFGGISIWGNLFGFHAHL